MLFGLVSAGRVNDKIRPEPFSEQEQRVAEDARERKRAIGKRIESTAGQRSENGLEELSETLERCDEIGRSGHGASVCRLLRDYLQMACDHGNPFSSPRPTPLY